MNIFGLERFSLRLQYLFFVGIVSWIIILGVVWITYSTYSTFEADHNEQLQFQGVKIQYVFDEKVSYIEHFLQFIGSQIVNTKALSIKDIALMIQFNSFSREDNAITWNVVDYITPEGFLVADNTKNVTKPINVNGQRDWLNKAKRDLWHLNFSNPSLGFITGDYIVPCGIAFEDPVNKKFFGYLSSGISIAKLTSSLSQLVGEQYVFAIFDDDLDPITTSDPFIEEADFKKAFIQQKSKLSRKKGTTLKLPKPIKMGDSLFTHYIHSEKFPFYFVIGFDQNLYSKDLWAEITPKLVVNLALWIIFSSILGYLSYQVVKPIIILGKAADGISKGKAVELPDFRAIELNILARQLRNIAKIHNSLKNKQAKIAKANSDLSAANGFIKSNMSFLSHELINPTSSIVEFSKMLKKKLQGQVDKDSQEYLDIINKASIHLNKQLNFFMRLFKFQAEKRGLEETKIHLKELVEWNLSMIMHHAKYKGVKIITKVPETLRLLGDEIMIGQMIQNVAANGAKYNVENGQLTVSASINRKGETELFFEDTGIGISKKDLNNIFKLFKRAKSTENGKTLGYGIGLAYAQKCIDAHGGKISVTSKIGAGTVFKVTFPRSRTV